MMQTLCTDLIISKDLMVQVASKWHKPKAIATAAAAVRGAEHEILATRKCTPSMPGNQPIHMPSGASPLRAKADQTKTCPQEIFRIGVPSNIQAPSKCCQLP
jgi:hypothetical protein